jgi:hypothetical protein
VAERLLVWSLWTIIFPKGKIFIEFFSKAWYENQLRE